MELIAGVLRQLTIERNLCKLNVSWRTPQAVRVAEAHHVLVFQRRS